MIAADVTGSLLGKVLLDIVGADQNGESAELGNSTARYTAFSESEKCSREMFETYTSNHN